MNMKRYCWLLVAFFMSTLEAYPIDLKKLHTPEYYTDTIQSCFSQNKWGEGKILLDEAMELYSKESNIQYLMGKYWYNQKDYNRARYYLVKATEINYNHVAAKRLLIDIEEETGNYSSAICYVNELLEVSPYWRDLWRRKIGLYRKQGNEVEADRLLKRINQIYPNDTLLRKDYLYTMELHYIAQKKQGRRKEAIETLNELLRYENNNEQYYLDVINLYLQEGDLQKALEWANNGVSVLPESMPLIYKKIGILSDLFNYSEALAFVRRCMQKFPYSADLRRTYNNLLLEAAHAEKQNNPYELFRMAYESGEKSRENLDFLLNTALKQGYDEDALYYIGEIKQRYGADKTVLYKEYVIRSRRNEEARAYSILQELYRTYPDDYDIGFAMCKIERDEAERLIDKGLYSEALSHARFVAGQKIDREMMLWGWDKVLDCNIQLKRYQEALVVLDTIAGLHAEYGAYVEKKAYILDQTGRTREALKLYRTAYDRTNDDYLRKHYAIGYEELAIPYIKKCMEAGRAQVAYEMACDLLYINPSSDLGLRYAINSLILLDKEDSLRYYVDQGLTYYPDEIFYKIKKAALYDQDKQYQESVHFLRPELDIYPDSKELTGAFSQSSEYLALQLMKEKESGQAFAVLDTALAFDLTNKSLKYTKGLVFEQQKQYDSAYYYQRFYEPAPDERYVFKRHLMGLKNKTYTNEIGVQYLQSRYGDSYEIMSLAMLEYVRKNARNTFTGRLNYSGRNGVADFDNALAVDMGEKGGTGIQLQGEWTHRFCSTWEGMINLAWANRYFPRVTANVGITKFLKNDWEVDLHGGYRYLPSDINLASFGAGGSKNLDAWRLSAKLDLYAMKSSIYYNALLQARYFPFEDNRTSITALGSVGSAPELSIVDYSLPGTFAHVNTMVGLGGEYLLMDKVSLGLLGTWHTYYSQTLKSNHIVTKSRNLYNVYVQVRIFF